MLQRRSHLVARLVALVLLCASTAAAGCTTWRAARLYVEGTHALDAGHPQRAVDALERAAALAPQASEIRNHLGLAYRAAGRREEALAAFDAAVALDCTNDAARRNRAALRASLQEGP